MVLGSDGDRVLESAFAPPEVVQTRTGACDASEVAELSVRREMLMLRFQLAERIKTATGHIRDLGDRAAIETERDRLQGEINHIKAAAQLTDEEVLDGGEEAFQKRRDKYKIF